MGNVSKQTATDIACAYREVEVAEDLLKIITESLKARSVPDIRDGFGRPLPGLQLGVPLGDNSQRLFNVPWSICEPILKLHITQNLTKIAVLTEQAKAEAAGATEGSDHV
jgi:hypothetical protein